MEKFDNKSYVKTSKIFSFLLKSNGSKRTENGQLISGIGENTLGVTKIIPKFLIGFMDYNITIDNVEKISRYPKLNFEDIMMKNIGVVYFSKELNKENNNFSFLHDAIQESHSIFFENNMIPLDQRVVNPVEFPLILNKFKFNFSDKILDRINEINGSKSFDFLKQQFNIAYIFDKIMWDKVDNCLVFVETKTDNVNTTIYNNNNFSFNNNNNNNNNRNRKSLKDIFLKFFNIAQITFYVYLFEIMIQFECIDLKPKFKLCLLGVSESINRLGYWIFNYNDMLKELVLNNENKNFNSILENLEVSYDNTCVTCKKILNKHTSIKCSELKIVKNNIICIECETKKRKRKNKNKLQNKNKKRKKKSNNNNNTEQFSEHKTNEYKEIHGEIKKLEEVEIKLECNLNINCKIESKYKSNLVFDERDITYNICDKCYSDLLCLKDKCKNKVEFIYLYENDMFYLCRIHFNELTKD